MNQEKVRQNGFEDKMMDLMEDEIIDLIEDERPTSTELCKSILHSQINEINTDDSDYCISVEEDSSSSISFQSAKENSTESLNKDKLEDQNICPVLTNKKIAQSQSSRWLPKINDVVSIQDSQGKENGHSVFLAEDRIKLEKFVDESSEYNKYMSGFCVKLEKLEGFDNLITDYNSTSINESNSPKRKLLSRSLRSNMSSEKNSNNVAKRSLRIRSREKNIIVSSQLTNKSTKNNLSKSVRNKDTTTTTKNKYITDKEVNKENKKSNLRNHKNLRGKSKTLNNKISRNTLIDKKLSKPTTRLSIKSSKISSLENSDKNESVIPPRSKGRPPLKKDQNKIDNSKGIKKKINVRNNVINKKTSTPILSDKEKEEKSPRNLRKRDVRVTESKNDDNRLSLPKIKKPDPEPSPYSAYESVEEFQKTVDSIYECLCCEQKYNLLEQVKEHVRGHFPDVITS